MDWLQEMYKCFGQMGLWLGVTIGAAYLAFRFLGVRWIEDRFATRLEAHKHEQAKELEELRHKISSALSRVTKIHEKEFEVLPEAWNKLQDAIARISGIVSSYQQCPDLNRMTPVELSVFIHQSGLDDLEKEEVHQRDDKTAYYREKSLWHDLTNASDAFCAFHNYTIRNRVFLSSDLFELFQKIDHIMYQAMQRRACGGEGESGEIGDTYRKMRDEINPMRDDIERLIQKRLHFHEAE